MANSDGAGQFVDDPERRLAEIEAEQQRTLEENARAHEQFLAETEAGYQAYKRQQREADLQMTEVIKQFADATEQGQRDVEAMVAAHSTAREEQELHGDITEIRRALHNAIDRFLESFDPHRDRIVLNSVPIPDRNKNTPRTGYLSLTLYRE